MYFSLLNFKITQNIFVEKPVVAPCILALDSSIRAGFSI
jgi:hypothetical protein